MRAKRPAPDDLIAPEKTLWDQSEECHAKADELRDEARALRRQAKLAAQPLISQAEALEIQANSLDRTGNDNDMAMRRLINEREQGYITAQLKIIKQKNLGDCPKCDARSKTRGNTLRRSMPCMVSGTMKVLPAPHPERKPVM